MLFADRAVAAHADFTVTEAMAPDVATLCRRLDGLPLALELAAARVRVLSPAQMVSRLDGAFRVLGVSRGPVKHHETLRAALAWSYELLAQPERTLLRQLAVFRGGFGLDAVEAVGGSGEDVADVLGALVDKSLVVATDAGDGSRRFHLLEVVRDFALDLLTEHGEELDARRAHRDYFVSRTAPRTQVDHRRTA